MRCYDERLQDRQLRVALAGARADAEYTVLTAAQKTRFDASGYLVLEGFLDRDACGSLEEEVDALATRRAAGERPSVVHSRALALLTSHPRMIAIVGQLMGCRAFAMHHIHAARHDAGLPGVSWHQDYCSAPTIFPARSPWIAWRPAPPSLCIRRCSTPGVRSRAVKAGDATSSTFPVIPGSQKSTRSYSPWAPTATGVTRGCSKRRASSTGDQRQSGSGR